MIPLSSKTAKLIYYVNICGTEKQGTDKENSEL